MTVAKLIKKAALVSFRLPRRRLEKFQRKKSEALELDEMCTFVGRRKRKVWLWLAIERVSRRIVAWVLGCRAATTAQRLWAALPQGYRRHCRYHYHTDQWEAYDKVQSADAHRPHPKGSG